MRLSLLLLATAIAAVPAHGWEHLVTRDGVQIEGDITQEEFILDDPSGGEIVIPRPAISQFTAEGDMVNATLKDGTVVSGHFAGKVEIEDGLIRRRYDGSDIQRIDFDLYIPLVKGESYHSCPIRFSIPALNVLIAEASASSTAVTDSVNCDDLKIANIAFTRHGKLKPGKNSSLTARVAVVIPEGADQLVDLSLHLAQGDVVLGKAQKRLVIDEGEVNIVPLKLAVQGDKHQESGPEPIFKVQLVNQDEEREVERGGVFWWFTIPL